MQGLMKICLEVCAVDLSEVYSPALFNESAAVAVELETGCNLDTQSRRNESSNELRTAKPKILIANPSRPLFLKLQNSNIGKSNELESTENTVITARFHLIFAVRECIEQMHRGDHVIFEHPSNASSWNELCVQKLVAQPSVFRVEGPMCRWHLLSGESGFMREPVSWLTNIPHLAPALEHWRENASGTEPDRDMQVKKGSASARYPVELVESFLRVVREDLRGSDEIPNVKAFAARPSAHEVCLEEEIFVDNVRGGVLEEERVRQARREEVQLLAWASGSPSFVRTWMQTKPRRCPYAGLTLTRATRGLTFPLQLNSSAGGHLCKV